MIQPKVIRKTAFYREHRLRISPTIGYARYAVSARTNLYRNAENLQSDFKGRDNNNSAPVSDYIYYTIIFLAGIIIRVSGVRIPAPLP